MTHPHTLGLVLAVQPTARGFGWVLFEGNMVPVDWGVSRPKRDFTAWCMRRFEKLVRDYEPSTLVLEAFDKKNSRRGDRIRTLAKTMRGFAINHDMAVAIYDREVVSTAVANSSEATRYDVAMAAGQRLSILQHEILPKQEVWQPEPDRRCLFDAAALGVTHYELTHRR